MKIAIPLFKERISPHFLTAPDLLVVLAKGRKISSTIRLRFSTLSLSERKQKLLSLEVDILICGGIDWATKAGLERYGIRVIDNTMGEVGEILSHLSRTAKGITKEEKGKARKRFGAEKEIGPTGKRKLRHRGRLGANRWRKGVERGGCS